jgi:hypothetical protein
VRELTSLNQKLQEIEDRRAKGDGELRDRIVRVEAEVENLPGHSQVADLTRNIQEVSGEVGGVRDLLNMLGQRIERIDNYLMSEKGRK